jgi:integrase
MRPERTLQFNETDKSEKVQDFLITKAIRSQRTKNVYRFALSHFQTFLSTSEYKDYNIEGILIPLNEKTIDVYLVLRKFIHYLSAREYSDSKLSPATVSLYVAGVRSYLEHHDIDISPHKFKKRVTMPKQYRDTKAAINAEDIRTLLLACTNARLKCFILVLASSGMRANEALSLRIRDIDFSKSPTKVHIRAEISKTKQGNDVYISDEAAKEIKKLIDSKQAINPNSNDLIFGIYKETQTISIYKTLRQHFINLLDVTGMNQRKDGTQRMQISFHTFRGFVKTVISNQGYGDYSEWIEGRRNTMSMRYFSMKEQEKEEIYKNCMKYLTFLDYPTVQAVGKDFESKLQERDIQITNLTKKDIEREDVLQSLIKEVKKLKVDKNRSEKKMEQVTKKLEEIERREEEAEVAYESAMAELDSRLGK